MKDLIKALYLGDAGSGKTTQGLLALKAGRSVRMFDLENGVAPRALRRVGVELPAGWSSVPVRQTKVLDAGLLKTLDQLDAEHKDAPDVVMIDTASELNALHLSEQGVDRVKRGGNNQNRWKNDIDEYGVWTNYARYTWRMLRDMAAHTVVTVQEIKAVDEATETIGYITDITPKSDVALRAAFNTVVHMRQEYLAGERFVYGIVKNDGMYRGKDQLGLFPAHGLLVNPGMDKLLGMLDGDLDPADDADTKRYIAAKQAAKKS